MARWYEAANEASFKPLAEGYVFQSPNPWIFARPRYYLVTGAQKAEIFALLGRWRLLLITAILIIFALFGSLISFMTFFPAAFMRLAGPALQFGIAPFSVLVSGLLMLLIVPLIAVPQIYLSRGLRAPLAYAPRTNERITMAEQLPKLAGAVSGKVLVLCLVCGICLMGSAILGLVDAYFEGHLARYPLLTFLPLFALGGLLTGYIVYLIRLRKKLLSAEM
jgi:hypothetical protein